MEGKKVSDSTVTMAHVMLPQDANPAGNIHGGVIMKFIDDAALVTATRHSGSRSVTASIDRLDFHYPVFVGNLLILKASINMTGKTSMEIGVRVEAEDLMEGEVNHIASAYLTFVSLNKNGRPKLIPPLIIETEREEKRNQEALDRKKMRIMEKKRESGKS